MNPVETVPSTEEQLKAEVERLKRELDEQKRSKDGHSALAHPVRPSGKKLFALLLLVAIVFAAAFALGYIPHQRRELQFVAEADVQKESLPEASFAVAERGSRNGTLVLPGNIQAVTEAPILARAEGYILQRYADIGDRVTAGQFLAEIEAPDLDQQVRQAQAAVQQAQADLERTRAALEQGRANEVARQSQRIALGEFGQARRRFQAGERSVSNPVPGPSRQRPRAGPRGRRRGRELVGVAGQCRPPLRPA